MRRGSGDQGPIGRFWGGRRELLVKNNESLEVGIGQRLNSRRQRLVSDIIRAVAGSRSSS